MEAIPTCAAIEDTCADLTAEIQTGGVGHAPPAASNLSDTRNQREPEDGNEIQACDSDVRDADLELDQSDVDESDTDDYTDEDDDLTCEHWSRKPTLARQLHAHRRSADTSGEPAEDLGVSISAFLCKSLLLPPGSLSSLPISPPSAQSPTSSTAPVELSTVGIAGGWMWGSLSTSFNELGFAWQKDQQRQKELQAPAALVIGQAPALLAKEIGPYKIESLLALQSRFESPRAQQVLIARVLNARACRWPDTEREEKEQALIDCALPREVL